MKRKILGYAMFIISAIAMPLNIYPFILIADLVSLTGSGVLIIENIKDVAGLVLMISFILLNFLYPVTYFICLIKFKKEKVSKILFAIIPYIHFAVLALLFGLLYRGYRGVLLYSIIF